MGKLKITDEDYAELKVCVHRGFDCVVCRGFDCVDCALDFSVPKEAFLQSIAERRLSLNAFAWNCLFGYAKDGFIAKLYDYLDDSHIDTALGHAVEEYTWPAKN